MLKADSAIVDCSVFSLDIIAPFLHQTERTPYLPFYHRSRYSQPLPLQPSKSRLIDAHEAHSVAGAQREVAIGDTNQL